MLTIVFRECCRGLGGDPPAAVLHFEASEQAAQKESAFAEADFQMEIGGQNL